MESFERSSNLFGRNISNSTSCATADHFQVILFFSLCFFCKVLITSNHKEYVYETHSLLLFWSLKDREGKGKKIGRKSTIQRSLKSIIKMNAKD